MDFIVETITPDFFYYNLLLGLPKILDKRKRSGIRKKHLVRFEPATDEQVREWEVFNEVHLPLDLKKFYKSTNGFLYQWICSYGYQKLLVMGKISIYPLHKLKQITDYQVWNLPEEGMKDSVRFLKLGGCSKVFELSCVDDDYKICLVYLFPDMYPSIWLFTKMGQFFYLAGNFTEYFRMSIAHLGVPHWQLAYTPMGLPEWVKILMRLICPGVLNATKHRRSVDMIKEERIKNANDRYLNSPINALDTSVFNEQYQMRRRPGDNGRNRDNAEIFLLKTPHKKKTKTKGSRMGNKHCSNSTKSKTKSKKG